MALNLLNRVNVVSSGIHMLKPTPPPFTGVVIFGDEFFGRWLDHEGRILMNRIRVLINVVPESCLTPTSVWGYNEKTAFYEWGRRSSTHTKSASAWDFPVPKTVRYISVFCKLPCLWQFCWSSRNTLKQIEHSFILLQGLRTFCSLVEKLLRTWLQPYFLVYLGFFLLTWS